MSFFKMLLSFAPWLSFLIIAHGSMFRLKVGIIVAAILSVVMAVTKLHRGVIMWVGLLFFSYAIVAVLFMNNMWTVRHMGVLANGALALGTWAGIVFKRPFTLEYAREHTDPSLWNNPLFLKTNYLLTSIWAAVFSINAGMALQRMTHPVLPALAYELISYTLLILAMFFSTWYPKYLAQKRIAEQAA
jgi:hypothetical protein